jgi:hypothetical protein
MAITDQRLEEIRAWACGESAQDAAMKPDELAAIANELKQLRLRTLSRSRAAAAPSGAVGH